MLISKQLKEFKVKVKLLNKFTNREIKKIEDATQFFCEKFLSNEFLEYVLSYKYTVTKYRWEGLRKVTWKETFKGFWESQGKTQLEIYNSILSGKEILIPEVDNEADIFLKVDRTHNAGGLAYTYKSKNTIWVYEYTLKNKSFKFIAGTLLHEYAHKCGYSHDSGKRKRHTVPYGLGDGLRLM